MADRKVTELSPITAAELADDDKFLVVDVSEDETKSLTSGVLQSKLTTKELTRSGNLNFGDNVKATFGAGSDLQIYHDGANSYVKDAGDGVLNVQGSAQVNIGSVNGTIGVQFVEGANVTLRHNNSPKLTTTSTGVDVTGTVTADGLTVDGGVLFDGNTNGDYSLVLGNNEGASGSVKGITRLGMQGQGASFATYKGAEIRAEELQLGDYRTELFFATRSDTSDVAPKDRIKIANQGDISFYEDTGTTAKFFWDASAERLGIGTSSPTQALDVTGDIVISGGVYLGGTGAANLLDDYEEGAWTPTLSSSGTVPTVSSYNTRVGMYTKVGDTVTFMAIIRATLSSSGSGSPTVTGLPFAAGTSLPAAYVGLKNLLSGTPSPYISSTRVQIDGTSYIAGSLAYLCVSGTYKV